LLDRCLKLGARIAEPGEFTRRAFLNGKLDLAQAEGVADLIEASTASAARAAARSLSGGYSTEIGRVRDALIDLRMLVEATLDFPEEEIDLLKSSGVHERLAALEATLGGIQDRARQGSLLRSGMQVVLIGQPNVGKSSLLNRLAGHERAIVTDVAGTTRDALRETIQIEGIPLHITDTAGLRDTADPVEKIGVERTWQAIATADVILKIIDLSAHASDAGRAIDARLPADSEQITVFNKIDLVQRPAELRTEPSGTSIFLSATEDLGVDLLRAELLRVAGWHQHGDDVILARERHLRDIGSALAATGRATESADQIELMAEELRVAHDSLAAITGEFTADDLLGAIFSRFCIGK
jgi:tRNA modification GTPase